MGFFSDAWDSVKDTVSDVWDDTKDAVKDITGIDSMNDLLMPGFGVASGASLLSGGGPLGSLLGGQQAPPNMAAVSGPLTQPAPANLTMGTARNPPSGSAGLMSPGGDMGGQSPALSAALLQSNPEAFQYQPLISSMA